MEETSMVEDLVPDELWRRLEPLLPAQQTVRHVKWAGRNPASHRKVVAGIIFVLRTGVPWRNLPATSDFPSGHTCRKYLVKWHRAGIWKKALEEILAELQKRGKIKWKRGIVDSASVRAPGGGNKTGRNPTDRGKLGTKHHILTDADGTPLAVVLTGANRHDVTQLIPLAEKIPPIRGKRGRPRKRPEKLLGDRGYDSEPHRKKLKKNGHQATARQRKHSSRKRPWKTTMAS